MNTLQCHLCFGLLHLFTIGECFPRQNRVLTLNLWCWSCCSSRSSGQTKRGFVDQLSRDVTKRHHRIPDTQLSQNPHSLLFFWGSWLTFALGYFRKLRGITSKCRRLFLRLHALYTTRNAIQNECLRWADNRWCKNRQTQVTFRVYCSALKPKSNKLTQIYLWINKAKQAKTRAKLLTNNTCLPQSKHFAAFWTIDHDFTMIRFYLCIW